MYLRVTKRRNADGSEVRYYQLADNVWDPEKRHSSDVAGHSFERPAKPAAPGIARQRKPQAGDVAQEGPQGDALGVGRGRHQPDRHAA